MYYGYCDFFDFTNSDHKKVAEVLDKFVKDGDIDSVIAMARDAAENNMLHKLKNETHCADGLVIIPPFFVDLVDSFEKIQLLSNDVADLGNSVCLLLEKLEDISCRDYISSNFGNDIRQMIYDIRSSNVKLY